MAFKILEINNFGGGQSDSDYEATVGQFFASQDFDIFTDPRVLKSNYPMGLETKLNAYSAQVLGSYLSYGIDLYCSANSGVLLKKDGSLSNTTGNWVTAVSNSAVISGKLTEYKGNFIWGTNIYYPATGNVSANALSAATNITYKHAPSDEIYFAATNSVHSYNGTTFTPVATTIPVNMDIQGMTNYENYVVIGAKDIRRNDTSKLFYWDSYTMVPEGLVDIGDPTLKVVQNVGGVVVVITAPTDINFHEWRGGKIYKTKTIKTSIGTNDDGTGTEILKFSNPTVRNGILYVGISGSKNFPQGIYAYKPDPSYPNKAVLTLDKTTSINTTTNSAVSINNIHIHTDWVAERTYANLANTTDTVKMANYSDTGRGGSVGGIWQSIIYEPFPGQASQPVRVSMEYEPLPASASMSAFTKVDNASTWSFIGSTGTSGTVKNDFYDRNGYAFDVGNHHQFKISSSGNTELLKLIVKFKDAENR